MKTAANVRVQWTPEKIAHLPSSTSYITVAKFAEDAAQWPKEGWSIVINFTSVELAQSPEFEATARFLMPDAPWERLKAGCVFELYEGAKKTATVTVL